MFNLNLLFWILCFLAAVLPVLALCYYIYKKDVNPEPSKTLLRIFVCGCITTIPIIFLEVFIQKYYSLDTVLENFWLLFINIFISVAFIEEGFKWIVTKKLGYDIKEFDEIYDIIVYSVFASLGFACVENILYVFSNGLGNALLRAFTSVPGHTCFGVVMGYYFSKAKMSEISKEENKCRKYMILSFIIPTVLHTFYNTVILHFAATGIFSFLFLFLIFLSLMFITSFKIVDEVSDEQRFLYNDIEEENLNMIVNESSQKDALSAKKGVHFCSNCGNNVDGCNYCTSCGFKIC